MSEARPVGNARMVSFWEENKKVCIAGAAITLLVVGIITLILLQRSNGNIDIEGFIKSKEGIAVSITVGILVTTAVFAGIYKCCSVGKREPVQRSNEENDEDGIVGLPSKPGELPSRYDYSVGYHDFTINYYSKTTVGQIKNKIHQQMAFAEMAYSLDIRERKRNVAVADNAEFHGNTMCAVIQLGEL